MKKFLFIAFCFLPYFGLSQTSRRNIIIITIDGFRWQEVFRGMDTAIASNSRFNENDSAYLFNKYWATNQSERRRLLLPFLWKEIAGKGQIYGNREYGCKVDNANPYWFSYPGYNEIFTGYPDTAINSNSYPPNPHVNVLEFFNRQPALKGKVVAFTAWEAFNRILNESRSKIPVIAAFDLTGSVAIDANRNPEFYAKKVNGKYAAPLPVKTTAAEKLINDMRNDSYKPFGDEECLDVFTHYAAMEWLKVRKPRVLYISYGETDEWAHAGKYRSYLDAAHQVDQWISDIWNFIQSHPQYKNNTTLFITSDHGRGDIKKEEWTEHNKSVSDSHEIWFSVLGPAVSSKGEIKDNMQLYQEQFAQTIAKLMGYQYRAHHPIAEEIKEIFKK